MDHFNKYKITFDNIITITCNKEIKIDIEVM